MRTIEKKQSCRERILKAYEKMLAKRIRPKEESDYVPSQPDPDMGIILGEEVEG